MLDLGTAQTLEFVRSVLPAGACRLLEVGCGSGRLAAELAAGGCRITALDADGDAVAHARARGLDARRCDWPEFAPDDAAPYQAVLFTRSLHHMAEPRAAVARAAQLLAPKGMLIVEEFAVEALDEWTAGWFASLLRLLDAAGQLGAERPALVEQMLRSPRPLAVWRAEHADHAHPTAVLEAAIDAAFDSRQSSAASYLYRYLLELLGPAAAAIAGEILRLELALGKIRPASLIGRRYVAHRPP